MKYKTTEDIEVPERMIDQVVGQERAINIVKKAANQKRNIILVGEPGTGKSLIGQALAELLPKEKLKDILSFPNEADENVPKIKTMHAGEGSKLITRLKLQAMGSLKNQTILLFAIVILISLLPYYLWKKGEISDIIYASSMITSMVFIIGFMLFLNLNKRMASTKKNPIPKLIINSSRKEQVPFIDATGAHAGALLGDVLHDPLQSGGLGTPAHERIIPGMVHRANGGVLFIDEIGNISKRSQQELLTIIQEKKYPITGQSDRSSGAMVRSEPAPTEFIFVAAGTLETVNHMHPALRSRIRGYGYEVYMKDDMADTQKNRLK